jgi:3-deoxy-D-manno-octulosonic acid kinase
MDNTILRARTLKLPGGAMRFDPAGVSSPDGHLFDAADPRLCAEPVGQGGRQAAWFVSGDFGAAVLRHYRRGGLVARISRRHYVWTGAGRTRSFAEFDLMFALHRLGLPVPRPLAAAYWRTGILYRAALLVERIPDVTALAGSLSDDTCLPVAEAVLALHEAGVWHADLNAFNILLDADNRAWLIDFDRGRRRNMTPRLRNANLLRLRRSLVKVAGTQGERYWAALNDAYQRRYAEKG